MSEISVRFPPHLRRFIELPAACEAEAVTVAELMDDLESRYQGVKSYLLHENGQLRQHVNLFLDGRLVLEQDLAEIELGSAKELVIMQALSGG